MTDAQPSLAEPLSFRDPEGRVIRVGQRILRLVQPEAAARVAALLASPLALALVAEEKLVPARAIASSEARDLLGDELSVDSAMLVLEHDPVVLPTYPWEWPPEMLHDAAALTLELARRSLADGQGLKDATPSNVLFRGTRPVFVDWLSFEARDPLDPTWLPYAQFLRTFILPLLAMRDFGLHPAQIFLPFRDGLTPEQAHGLAGPLRALLPPFLTLATLPTWLGRLASGQQAALYRPRRAAEPRQARFVLDRLFRGLDRMLARATPRASRSSAWSGYMEARPEPEAARRAAPDHYTADQFEAKRRFVEEALREAAPRRVLDLGCNTGFFSLLAARAGASVVALDADPVVLGRLHVRARTECLPVLPLLADIARPSPAVGFRNAEALSLLDRLRGASDAVLLLAALHHLLVTERVPLVEVISLLAELTTGIAIVELVGPQDPMFRLIARGRERLHEGLDAKRFEAACRGSFDVLRMLRLEGTERWLYLLRKR